MAKNQGSVTRVLSHIGPRQMAANAAGMAMDAKDVVNVDALRSLGINFNGKLGMMAEAHGMDSNDVGIAPSPLSGLSSASISVPVQFLQVWMPGFVRMITAARKMDELVGITTMGSWEDEEVVQGVLEPLGTAVPYGDYRNVPFSSYNTNFERRTLVRFEMGIQVGTLEEARASRIRVSTSAEKRESASLALEIQRNRVGFYGFNDGANRTYGLLNDPALPAYSNFPNGASGSPLWSGKTFLEITADIRLMLQQLRTQSFDNIDPRKTPITFAVPTNAIEYLTVTNTLGSQSVATWLQETYPNVRVESAPELNDANGGASAFYMYAETVPNTGSDGGQVFIQVVPTKFQALGVKKEIKGYEEGYSNAMGGVMCKRPYAVVRRSGG